MHHENPQQLPRCLVPAQSFQRVGLLSQFFPLRRQKRHQYAPVFIHHRRPPFNSANLLRKSRAENALCQANKLALMGLVPGWRTVYSYNTRLPARTPPPVLSRPSPGAPGLGRERTGGGVGRGTRFIAGNARHPGTKPGQPAIKGTLNTYLPYGRVGPAPRDLFPSVQISFRPSRSPCELLSHSRFSRIRGAFLFIRVHSWFLSFPQSVCALAYICRCLNCNLSSST